MLKNYFIIAIRYLYRNKLQSIIQIASLTIGIAVMIQIGLYVDYEISFDKFNEKLDRIYRLEYGDFAGNASAVGHNIKENFPEVEDVVRIMRPVTTRISYITDLGNGLNKTTDLKVKSVVCDSTLFDVFTFPFIQGDPVTALRDPRSVVLTESAARALFGNQDPIGEVLELETADSTQNFINITGIIHDPKNSHIDFDILLPMVSLKDDTLGSGEKMLNTYQISANWYTYLLLQDPEQKPNIEKRINEFFSEPVKDGPYYSQENIFTMRPLGKVYFSKPLRREWGYCLHGNLSQVRILLAIAVCILLLACINYINLTTARAIMRAREVGVRKGLGAHKPQLILQFLLESIVTILVSSFIALTIVQLLLPVFNELAIADINIERLLEPKILLITISGIAILGVIAGIYPAIYMTSFRTMASLKGEQLKGDRSILFRRVLLTLQYTISVMLIIGVFSFLGQLRYMKTSELGFNKELIINIPDRGPTIDKHQIIKERLLKNPVVQKVSFGSVPGDRIQPFPGYLEYQNVKLKPSIVWIDPDYFDLMNIKILEGRNFTWDREEDMWRGRSRAKENRCKILINEAAERAYNLKSPLGEILTYEGGNLYDGIRYEVIGVVEDFHFFSLHHKIKPTVFFWHKRNNTQETIKFIKTEYVSLFPNMTFEFSFLDDTYNKQYENDERLSVIISNFAFVAILLGCLGLFGLSFFMAARRTKEIGIRKSLGASDHAIFILLSKEFIKWVALSVIIAWPTAWLILSKWFQSFAYRTNISWWIFLLAAFIAFAISFITVAWHAWETARTNPIEALRYE